MSFNRPAWLIGSLAVLLTVLVYGNHLGNGLIFDDARLTDGSVFGQYGSFDHLRVRWLSYGTFVWLAMLWGEWWPAQRGFNLLVHLLVGTALYMWLTSLLRVTAAEVDKTKVQRALLMGLAIWAVNPVAAYAVGYLIQRSVLMATLGVVLALWCTTKAFANGRPAWLAGTTLAFALAVLSKEHAITAVLLVPVLYVLIKKPRVGQLVRVAGAAALLLGFAAWLLWKNYGSIVGTVFDETSVAYVQQLEALQPGVAERVYGLSIINQAWLFFQYGALWLLPLPSYLSMDLRPPFPLSLHSFPQVLGLPAYLALIGVGGWLVFRKTGLAALAGSLLLVAPLLFATEFATVWVQDPFVLYRSYLWSIALPGLFALALLWLDWTGKYTVGCAVLLCLMFAGGTYDRLHSLSNARPAWKDATEKVDLQAPANAVGRWRPFLNLASEELERGNTDEAIRLYRLAVQLGEPQGSANFGLGVALQQRKQHPAALAALAAAEKQGFTEAAVYFHMGESAYAAGNFSLAYKHFSMAATKPQDVSATRYTNLRLAESAVATQQYSVAADAYANLLKQEPNNSRYLVGLSMAHIGAKEYAQALSIIEPILNSRPHPQALYVRALIHYHQGNLTNSQKDLQMALATDPQNPVFLSLQRQLSKR